MPDASAPPAALRPTRPGHGRSSAVRRAGRTGRRTRLQTYHAERPRQGRRRTDMDEPGDGQSARIGAHLLSSGLPSSARGPQEPTTTRIRTAMSQPPEYPGNPADPWGGNQGAPGYPPPPAPPGYGTPPPPPGYGAPPPAARIRPAARLRRAPTARLRHARPPPGYGPGPGGHAAPGYGTPPPPPGYGPPASAPAGYPPPAGYGGPPKSAVQRGRCIQLGMEQVHPERRSARRFVVIYAPGDRRNHRCDDRPHASPYSSSATLPTPTPTATPPKR